MTILVKHKPDASYGNWIVEVDGQTASTHRKKRRAKQEAKKIARNIQRNADLDRRPHVRVQSARNNTWSTI